MVASQLRGRGIADERVLAAMGAVPRELFVPESIQRDAYADEALPIGAGQTISQPYMVAKMTEDLAVRPGDRILEIGTGSGYQAAILAWLGAQVTSIERQASLIPDARARLTAAGLGDAVTIREADGSLGDPGRRAVGRHPRHGRRARGAPAAPRPAARRQTPCHPGRHARPPAPDGDHRHGDEWLEEPDSACIFVPLIGAAGFDEVNR